MRKISAIFGIAAFAVVVFSPLPVAAFGIHLGPFYFHVPFVGHHYRHHLHMRANPKEARPRPNDVSRGGSYAARGDNATEQTDREARAAPNAEVLGSCTGLAPGVTNLPIDQIRQTVHPTADQEAALDDLSAASSQASDIIKSSCPSTIPLTPIGRLDAAEQRLQATIKAVQVVRAPLERFYQALSDEQRQRFNVMSGSTGGNLAAECSQQGRSFIDLPVQRIIIVPKHDSAHPYWPLGRGRAAIAGNHQSRTSCPRAA
jgi:LTXXQ motif family protein